MQTLLNFVSRRWKIITLSLLSAITLLSLWPLPEMQIPGTDKTHHFIAYGALMFPVALSQPRYWWAIALGFIAYSGMIELIQPYVNRYGEWLDLAANAGGVLTGIIVGDIMRRLFLNTHSRSE